MGGTALRIPTERLSNSQRDTVLDRLFPALKEIYSIVISPKVGPEKHSHGDVDIILSGTTLIPDSLKRQKMIASLGLHSKSGNSYLYYLDVMPIQVDLEYIDQHNLASHLFTASYGDLGIILCYACHTLGFSIGRNGLFYRSQDQENGNLGMKKYFVTKEPTIMCEILGLDYKQWSNGFHSELEAFEWILVLRPTLIRKPAETRNCIDRKLQSRSMYQKFLEFNTERLHNEAIVKKESLWRQQYRESFRNSEIFISTVKPSMIKDKNDALKREKMKLLLDRKMIYSVLDFQHNGVIEGRKLGFVYSQLKAIIDIDSDTLESVRKKLHDLKEKGVLDSVL